MNKKVNSTPSKDFTRLHLQLDPAIETYRHLLPHHIPETKFASEDYL